MLAATQAIARGIEPRLALDKKTHVALQSFSHPGNNSDAVDACKGDSKGRQFLKFEVWSTRASASCPGAAHASMRRQVQHKV